MLKAMAKRKEKDGKEPSLISTKDLSLLPTKK
jgi:hypothetical protein